MSADLLRRAAKVLREHAENATPGPWTYDRDISTDDEAIGSDAESEDCVLVYSHYAEGDVGIPIGPEDGAFVTLMHPPVALAMAAWLERIAAEVDRHGIDNLKSPKVRAAGLAAMIPGWAETEALARAILREES